VSRPPTAWGRWRTGERVSEEGRVIVKGFGLVCNIGDIKAAENLGWCIRPGVVLL
jgi:hypothetical protein